MCKIEDKICYKITAIVWNFNVNTKKIYLISPKELTKLDEKCGFDINNEDSDIDRFFKLLYFQIIKAF